MAVFKPLLTGVMKLALKAQGLSYLSDETIGTFIRSPLTWFFLLLIVLGMAFFTLFDMILYLLIIIPMTHALVISGYITKFTVPQFIVDYIMSHTWLAILYIGFWIYIGLRSFHWIYSLHYFCLENCNFKQARKRSWKLQKNHYWTDLIIVLGWSAACIGIYYGVILSGSWLVSRVNQALPTQDLFSSLTLSGISLLMDVCGALFFCFDLPLFFICISLLFYYRKAAAGERIPRVFRDLDMLTGLPIRDG